METTLLNLSNTKSMCFRLFSAHLSKDNITQSDGKRLVKKYVDVGIMDII